MYEGIVATGAVESRTHAKYGMLGAMYGGTQGVSGQVLPQQGTVFLSIADNAKANCVISQALSVPITMSATLA